MNKSTKYYSPSSYAKAKGVDPSRITHLRDKLIVFTYEEGKKYLIVDCEENDALFANPSPLRGSNHA